MTMAPLPHDLILDIAACSDPATLVRCAAACKDLRRDIADPAFRRRLRLRRTDDRLIPSLLRGHLVASRGAGGAGASARELRLVDTTSAYATRVLSAAACFPPGPDGEPLTAGELLGSRHGLLLVRNHHELRVCNPATGRSQALPRPAWQFDGHYVLLVGGAAVDGGVGRRFKVLQAAYMSGSISSVVSNLRLRMCSSEQLTWRTYYTKAIQPPVIHGSSGGGGTTRRLVTRRLPKPLVVGDSTVHWLCRTDTASYIVTLHVGAAQVTSTKLPASFHSACRETRMEHIVLASMSVGGRPVVLVADGDRVSMWAQNERSARWKERPAVVVEKKDVAEFTQTGGVTGWWNGVPRLEWFAERSGVVLMRFDTGGLFWLDVRSKEILRWFHFHTDDDSTVSFPYESELSSWVPTFRKTLAVFS